MKVRDLIKQLAKFDQNSTVIVTSSNFELDGSQVAVTSVYGTEEGSKKEQTFRDAFDGESYNKTTWSTQGGKLKVVKIS